MIDEYSKFRGTLYNVQGGKSGTGVSFSDVAGVEHAMGLVEETIEMLLGDERYQDMGAKAPRVRSSATELCCCRVAHDIAGTSVLGAVG